MCLGSMEGDPSVCYGAMVTVIHFIECLLQYTVHFVDHVYVTSLHIETFSMLLSLNVLHYMAFSRYFNLGMPCI